MRSSRVTSVCLTLALGVGVLCFGGQGKPYHIAGANKDEAGHWTPADVMEVARDGVKYEAQFLTAEQARAVIKGALGRDLNLLPARVDENVRGYFVFVLQIDNGSAIDVTFNPNQARLSTEKGDMEFALDYSALYEVAHPLGPQAPSLEELATAFFDRAVSIRAGGSVRKLLAFHAPRDDHYKQLMVRLAEVNVGAASIDVDFNFRKFFDK